MPRTPPLSVTDTLRHACRDWLAANETRTMRELGREASVSQSSLSQFLAEARSLNGESIDRLADFFGLSLSTRRKS